MTETKYGKYIIKRPVGKSVFEQITAPEVQISGQNDLKGSDFSMNWSYITQPFMMYDEACVYDFDRILYFIGEDPNEVTAFDAEIELFLGEEREKQLINTTSFVYITGGLKHCPLEIKRVGKPFLFIDMLFSSRLPE